jgi:voltage-gated potassium channel
MARLRIQRGSARTTLAATSIDRPVITLHDALRPFLRRFSWAGIYFLAVFLTGTVGYMLIEGWVWFEALYMSVTTVTSVGFMEVRPLSPGGRSFTIVLIFLGLTGLGIWWALITALIVELDLGGVLRRRRMMRSIEDLRNHFIVCGVGRMGRVVVDELEQSGQPFVVIEHDPSRLATLLENHPDVLVIEGDATREQTLRGARIARADNLLVCITARHLNPDLTTVARAYNEESVEKLRRAGAEHVISPNQTGGIRMAFSLLRPHVVSFLDCVISDVGIELRLEQAAIPETSHLVGQTLAEARIPQRTGLIILGLRRAGQEGRLIYNPGPETRLQSGDVMIVLGGSQQVQQLREYAAVGVEV